MWLFIKGPLELAQDLEAEILEMHPRSPISLCVRLSVGFSALKLALISTLHVPCDPAILLLDIAQRSSLIGV